MKRLLFGFAKSLLPVLALLLGLQTSWSASMVSNLNDNGPGSLRQLISDAAAGDTIGFSVIGSIVLTTGELVIDKNLTIAGPGSTIVFINRDSNAVPHFRILEVSANAMVHLSGVTVSNGFPNDAGGGILNNGVLTLDNVRIANNGPYVGSYLVPTIVDCGGCLNSAGATLVATNCSFHQNGCTGNGGGILNRGNLTLMSSTISGNQAGSAGGIASYGTLSMINCTVSGNEAHTIPPHGFQGGYVGGVAIGGSAELISDTISGNECPLADGGGISIYGSATVTMKNCILAANIAGSSSYLDLHGVVQSQGYNLIGVSTGDNGFGSTDLTGTPTAPLNPKLGPLQDNGGPTFTMALLPGSPAIDQGFNGGLLATDQRGMPRTHDQSGVTNAVGGDGTDAGAFEVESNTPTLGNISTRLSIGTGDSAMIGGFIITGTQAKTVIVRGIGPSLPVPGALADPVIDVHGPSGELLGSNDNWRDAATRQQIIDSGLAPANDLESALWGIINPAAYTVVVRGQNEATGVGLFEVYDLDRTVDAKLANISTRGFVSTGDNVMIGGTIILGDTQGRVLLRAIGPSLTNAGIANALPDPMLELHDGNGALLASNDNWRSDQEAEILATGIPPADDRESAILQTLLPGAYTAIVRGSGNSTGIAVVEAYQLNN